MAEEGHTAGGPAPEGLRYNNHSHGDGGRSRGRGRGRGRGGPRRGRGSGGGPHQHPHDPRGSFHPGGEGMIAGQPLPANPAARDVAITAARAHAVAPQVANTDANADEIDGEADVCFICANPVAHLAIGPCNHTTCHICGLRMRALYKTKDCAHCRTPAPFVIFTDDAEKRFEEYTDKDISTADTNIGIKYTMEEIVGDTVLLLRYNCPDASCDFAGLGWPDLHRHVKTVHRKRMCDLCTRNKKVFTHEHELFADRELEKHMKRGDDQPGAADQTGFKGHPLCGFCGERFYDDDKLYEHCRMKHERCFLCDRRDSRHPHYYLDYNALEDHFRKDHYLCKDKECMEKKFVVFESELDMQAHQLSEHAGKGIGRDARMVDMSGFDLRQSYQPERRGGGRRDGEGRAGGRGRGRGRDPNQDGVPPAHAQPLRRDELAFQRQMAIHSAQSVSNRTFGGQLTVPSSSSSSNTPSSNHLAPTSSTTNHSRPGSSHATPRAGNSGATTPRAHTADLTNPMETLAITDTSHMTPEERARFVRHGSVIERAANLIGNDAQKMAAFRDHVSSYRQTNITAPQLIDVFFTIFAETSSNALGTLVREVADLFEDKKKADDLRKAWQDWRAINEDYPSLPGLSGMHGETTSSTGWSSAAAANPEIPTAAPSQKHSTRVLKLKNSTRLGGPAPVATSKKHPPGWLPATSATTSAGRPPATGSSAAFPSLATSSKAHLSGPSSSNRPSWAASSTPQSTFSASSSANRTRTGGGDGFPALPAAPKPMSTIFGYGNGRSVRRDYGHSGDTGFQWGGGAEPPERAGGSGPGATGAGEADEGNVGKGKKKGKKQVLVQWG